MTLTPHRSPVRLSATAAAEAIEEYYANMRPFWHAVAPAADLGKRPLAVRLLGEQLAIARLGEQVVAYEDLCRHMGAALSVGEIVDGCGVRCGYHGWTYDASGTCVDIPARRGAAIPSEARVATYPAREAYGLIWVCLEPDAEHGLPPFPEFAEERYRMGPLRTYEAWTASAPRVIIGALDDTHFPWVHPGTLGDVDKPEAPDHRAWRGDDCVMSEYAVLQPVNPTILTDSSINGGAAFEEVTYTNDARPSSIRLLKVSSTGTYVIFLAVCPVAHNESLLFWRVGRDFDLDPGHDENYERFEDIVREQDRPIVESQRPWLLPPLNARLLLYVRPADLPLIEYQQWLEELGIPQI